MFNKVELIRVQNGFLVRSLECQNTNNIKNNK